MIEIEQTEVAEEHNIQIRSGAVMLEGELSIPEGAQGVVVFAHGSGSSRHSPGNQFVAQIIREAGVATLLFDLLTSEEEDCDVLTGQLRFDIRLLAERLIDATIWLKGELGHLRAGFFGASTGAGASLAAAAKLGNKVGAVVSRGGRPDLAGEALPQVTAPTLLIVGGLDYPVIEMNKNAYAMLRCEKELNIVADATHLFEVPGALVEVGRLAADWFQKHLHTSAQPLETRTDISWSANQGSWR